jgi:iron complex outermembrane receptor protein
LSIDRGLVQFSSTSELGTVNVNQFPLVQGVGVFIDQPSGDVAPVGLGAATLYIGLYATDTFDVTSRFSITAGGRFNFAQLNLTDDLGNDPALGGNHTYTHFNPMIGGTYKLTPNLTVYGDFAVANRTPTPLELACSDPNRPCLIDSALVADPDLKQVVTYTYEAGFRGQHKLPYGQLNWTLGAFHALKPTTSSPLRADPRPSILPERRRHAAPRRRSQRDLQGRSLERLRQLHLRRCHLQEFIDSGIAEQPLRRSKR